MSDIYEYNFEAQKNAKQQICRVAYTLNNTQPVSCTIIGEQPLFYMDYEEEMNEGEGVFNTSFLESQFDVEAFSSMGDEFFTEEDLDILKDEIKNLKSQIQSYDKFTSDFTQEDEARLEKFLDNMESCTSNTKRSQETSLETALEILSQSRVAKSYLDYAVNNGVKIKFSAQIEHAEYNRKSKTIFINTYQNETDIILNLTAELRRHWQHTHGALLNPLMFHPDQAILINRTQIADIAVSIIRTAWELQLSGYKDTWERLENSSMADLARSFAREAFLDFRTINNGEASSAVFESWFLSERCRSQDKVLIQKMLSDDKGFVFDLEDSSKSVTPDLIAALGEMPYGKNYLAQHVETIMNDPIFTDIRDRANANFLWFIKFERTFKEAESEMENSGKSVTASKMLQNDATQAKSIAEIIAFPGYDANAKPAKKSKFKLSKKQQSKAKTHAENIVYLRRWNAE